MSNLMGFTDKWLPLIYKALVETFQMTTISLFFALIFGVSIGIVLVITRPGYMFENKWIYGLLNVIVNIIRSIPFIILLFFILPFTKLVAGTIIGVRGVIVPLVIYATPYIARLIESALLEVSPGGSMSILWTKI